MVEVLRSLTMLCAQLRLTNNRPVKRVQSRYLSAPKLSVRCFNLLLRSILERAIVRAQAKCLGYDPAVEHSFRNPQIHSTGCRLAQEIASGHWAIAIYLPWVYMINPVLSSYCKTPILPNEQPHLYSKRLSDPDLTVRSGQGISHDRIMLHDTTPQQGMGSCDSTASPAQRCIAEHQTLCSFALKANSTLQPGRTSPQPIGTIGGQVAA